MDFSGKNVFGRVTRKSQNLYIQDRRAVCLKYRVLSVWLREIAYYVGNLRSTLMCTHPVSTGVIRW